MNEAWCQGPWQPLVLRSGDALPLQGMEGSRYVLVGVCSPCAAAFLQPPVLPCKAQEDNERNGADLVQAPREKYQGLRWKHSP